jgi:hypothetical protein
LLTAWLAIPAGVMAYPAGDIAYLIQYGIEPAMPEMASELTEDAVWRLVNY